MVDNSSYFLAEINPLCPCECPFFKCLGQFQLGCHGYIEDTNKAGDEEEDELDSQKPLDAVSDPFKADTSYRLPSQINSSAIINDNALTITYQLSEDLLPASNVKIFLYDTYGKLLNQIEDRPYVNGYHLVKMDVSTLASGFYFYTIAAGYQVHSKKITIIK